MRHEAELRLPRPRQTELQVGIEVLRDDDVGRGGGEPAAGRRQQRPGLTAGELERAAAVLAQACRRRGVCALVVTNALAGPLPRKSTSRKPLTAASPTLVVISRLSRVLWDDSRVS